MGALVTAIDNSGAITLTGAAAPTFNVNFKALEKILRKEQRRIALIPNRTSADAGAVTIKGPGGASVQMQMNVIVGADASAGFWSKGQAAKLTGKNPGEILIAAGGYGDDSPVCENSKGGNATVTAKKGECLIITLGGRGGGGVNHTAKAKRAAEREGGDGGRAKVVADGDGNEVYLRGGRGEDGRPGDKPKNPKGTGQDGGAGGNGGEVELDAGKSTYYDVVAGDGGDGGAGGKAGKGGTDGGDGSGGDGGDVTVHVGKGSKQGAATPGTGGTGLVKGDDGSVVVH